MSVNALARLDRAVILLKEARTLPDVAKIRAMASAAAEYARAEKLGSEALHYANEIKVRAARKAGELLAEMAKKAERVTQGGDKKSKSPAGILKSPTLSDLGVTPKESARWQMLARIPDATFERVLRGEKVPSETMEDIAAKYTLPELTKASPIPVNERTLRRAIHRGELPATLVFGRYRIAAEDFKKWLNKKCIPKAGGAA